MGLLSKLSGQMGPLVGLLGEEGILIGLPSIVGLIGGVLQPGWLFGTAPQLGKVIAKVLIGVAAPGDIERWA